MSIPGPGARRPRPQGQWRRGALLLAAGLVVLWAATQSWLLHTDTVPTSGTFVFAGPLPGLHAQRQNPKIARLAEGAAAKEATEDESEEEDESDEESDDDQGYVDQYTKSPDDLMAMRAKQYKYDQEPPKLWWKLQEIDTQAVMQRVGKEYLKPLSWFPNPGVKIGDVIRVSFLNIDPTTYERGDDILYEGTLIDIHSQRHKRVFHLRSIEGSGVTRIGREVKFPVHSPHITSMQVLQYQKCEYKNALFLRAQHVRPRRQTKSKNLVRLPIDSERTQLARKYTELQELGKADEIPPLRYYP